MDRVVRPLMCAALALLLLGTVPAAVARLQCGPPQAPRHKRVRFTSNPTTPWFSATIAPPEMATPSDRIIATGAAGRRETGVRASPVRWSAGQIASGTSQVTSGT